MKHESRRRCAAANPGNPEGRDARPHTCRRPRDYATSRPRGRQRARKCTWLQNHSRRSPSPHLRREPAPSHRPERSEGAARRGQGGGLQTGTGAARTNNSDENTKAGERRAPRLSRRSENLATQRSLKHLHLRSFPQPSQELAAAVLVAGLQNYAVHRIRGSALR